MKKYVVRLFNGNSTFYYLVKEPILGNGSLTAISIGDFAKIDSDYKAYFFKRDDKKLMLVGSIECKEINYDPYIEEGTGDTVRENVKDFFTRK